MTFLCSTNFPKSHNYVKSPIFLKFLLLFCLTPQLHFSLDPGSIPGSGRPPGEGNGNPLQYSSLENPMDGGAWSATVHGVTKSRTRLSDFTFTFKLGYWSLHNYILSSNGEPMMAKNQGVLGSVVLLTGSYRIPP